MPRFKWRHVTFVLSHIAMRMHNTHADRWEKVCNMADCKPAVGEKERSPGNQSQRANARRGRWWCYSRCAPRCVTRMVCACVSGRWRGYTRARCDFNGRKGKCGTQRNRCSACARGKRCSARRGGAARARVACVCSVQAVCRNVPGSCGSCLGRRCCMAVAAPKMIEPVPRIG